MAQEQADTGSIFDFLFVDHARIALYNAQFTGMGVMRQVVKSELTTDTKELGGSANAAVVGANLRTNQSASESLEKEYDPRWVEPLAFLDYAQRHDMLKSDLATAAIGDLVNVKAEIDFLNLDAVARVWSVLGEPQPGQRRASTLKRKGRTTTSKIADEELVGCDRNKAYKYTS